MKIVQVNLGRSLIANESLLNHCITNKIDIAFIQEPYTRRGKVYLLEENPNRCIHHSGRDEKIWSAIVVFNLDIQSGS